MHTTEERIELMHKRAERLEAKKRERISLLAGGAAVSLCLVLLIYAAAAMPSLSVTVSDNGAPSGMAASIFTGGQALGYIVIAVAAFLLGASVTVFCFRLSAWRRNWQRQDPAEEDKRC